jgi:predicted short-subunit dehydrogenase-like oxidoreductase (DUF2520 family)
MSSVILVGPGRAGLSVALALAAAGHQVTAVVARDGRAGAAAADRFGAAAATLGDPLGPGDLLILGVRDDAIVEVASILAPLVADVEAAVHLSGLAGLETLAPLRDAGVEIGSFHPLQTLPDPETGAGRLEGAWVAIDAESDRLRASLRDLASSIGATPFDVTAEARAVYHAAAAAAANFPLAALAMAEDLFAAAGVPFEAARPLVTTVVDNAFTLGPRPALTGPVARGDVGTVIAQIEAVRRFAPEWEHAFRAFVAVLAEMTGRRMDLP